MRSDDEAFPNSSWSFQDMLERVPVKERLGGRFRNVGSNPNPPNFSRNNGSNPNLPNSDFSRNVGSNRNPPDFYQNDPNTNRRPEDPFCRYDFGRRDREMNRDFAVDIEPFRAGSEIFQNLVDPIRVSPEQQNRNFFGRNVSGSDYYHSNRNLSTSDRRNPYDEFPKPKTDKNYPKNPSNRNSDSRQVTFSAFFSQKPFCLAFGFLNLINSQQKTYIA